MDKANVFKLILGVLGQVPSIIGTIKDTVKDSGATKKAKALTLTNLGLQVLDEIAPNVRKDAEFQRLVGLANDAIYEAAKYGQLLADKRAVN